MVIYSGDIVKCLDNKGVEGFLSTDKLYDVESVDYVNEEDVVEVRDDKGNRHYFKETRFKFHSESQYFYD
jgi:hypothetical protein